VKAAIQCKYSCDLCGIKRQIVTVAARQEEDVTTWMDKLCIPALVEDHRQRSPNCQPKSFTEVMIPITDDTEKIGALPPKKREN